MAFPDDDDDRNSAASSDNDQDELMEDADEGEPEMDGEAEGDDDDNDDNEGDGDEDNEDYQDAEDTQEQTNGVRNSNQPTVTRTSASPRPGSASAFSPPFTHQVRPEALTAKIYDIVPTIAAPQSTSINAVTATPDMRYWFTGGSDCYVRKYDGAATINGKTLLTVAQRHPFVDSVVKAGVLMSYWENEEPAPKAPNDESALSPVYSLAVHHKALWLLSGLESGCINLQSVRHDEGKRITSLQKHTSAVSVLTLSQDEKSVLSGSWDKNIFDWDLNTGTTKRSFDGSGGQISALETRPASSLPVPAESGEVEKRNGTFSSNNADNTITNGIAAEGNVNGFKTEEGTEDAPGDIVDDDSLFGGGDDANSLFGDNELAPSGGHFDNEDDEFSRAMDMEISQNEPVHDGDVDMSLMESLPAPAGLDLDDTFTAPPEEEDKAPEAPAAVTSPKPVNGLPHSEDVKLPIPAAEPATQDAVATSDSTFLAASMDGVLRVWDRRQQAPVATIPTRSGVPPWCMGACWSPDGNYIYAGRRNGTVEEFSLHQGLKAPTRTLKLPAGSGAVSAVRAMPNSRHLICASHDILRLYDLKESAAFKHSSVPFLIVPGPPRAGVISAIHIDPTCRFMLTAAGNRGWEGSNTEVLLGYEINIP